MEARRIFCLRQKVLTTVCSFASTLISQTVPAPTKPSEKKSAGLFFFTTATYRSSILLNGSIKKRRCFLHLHFFMEARRIELLSENLFTAGSPSAVYVQNSLCKDHTNKLFTSVASLFMGDSKLCRLTFTA